MIQALGKPGPSIFLPEQPKRTPMPGNRPKAKRPGSPLSPRGGDLMKPVLLAMGEVKDAGLNQRPSSADGLAFYRLGQGSKRLRTYLQIMIWVWVKIKPPGVGPQVLVHVSTYQGSFWAPIFDPLPFFQNAFQVIVRRYKPSLFKTACETY